MDNERDMDLNGMGKKNVDSNSINQRAVGSNKDQKSVAHNVGDAIEHAGDKLKEKGMDSLGSALHDTGDKIEHMNKDK
jgi:hypothetical protein